jgi:Lon protease-like protein
MAKGPFDLAYEDLPATLPVFPLAGVLLLPHGKLPLNIFEKRYLAMTRDALAGSRLIGMIQPTGMADTTRGPALFPTGCAGRIISFAETDDGRYLITLQGVIRFRIKEELDLMQGYRRVVPDYAPFQGDMAEAAQSVDDVGRARILKALLRYFRANNVSANWDAVKKMDDVTLVNMLSMSCPFEPTDKQALLESDGLAARGQVLAALLEMGAISPAGDPDDDTPPPTKH